MKHLSFWGDSPPLLDCSVTSSSSAASSSSSAASSTPFSFSSFLFLLFLPFRLSSLFLLSFLFLLLQSLSVWFPLTSLIWSDSSPLTSLSLFFFPFLFFFPSNSSEMPFCLDCCWNASTLSSSVRPFAVCSSSPRFPSSSSSLFFFFFFFFFLGCSSSPSSPSPFTSSNGSPWRFLFPPPWALLSLMSSTVVLCSSSPLLVVFDSPSSTLASPFSSPLFVADGWVDSALCSDSQRQKKMGQKKEKKITCGQWHY